MCDVPGWEDSRGVEHDIANQKGVWSAIKCCNSIRIAVVIPNSGMEMTNGRMDGVRSVATNI